VTSLVDFNHLRLDHFLFLTAPDPDDRPGLFIFCSSLAVKVGSQGLRSKSCTARPQVSRRGSPLDRGL
jgi:hypothetical protein